MTLTLSSVVPRLLALPSPGERLPLDLLRDLVREGWRDLVVCQRCGLTTTEPPSEPWCMEHGLKVETVPAWGLGVAMLTIGVANWGVDWDGVPSPWSLENEQLLRRLDARGPLNDPAKRHWAGPAHKSGKHLRDGSSAYPYGGLGLCHLDSGGLLDAYERWGWPSPGSQAEYAPRGEVIAFDVLRKTGTPGPGGRRGPLRSISVPRWRTWLRWSDALLARPEFHEWLIAYWLREFWAPSWDSARYAVAIPPAPLGAMEHGWDIMRACINARIRNSAKGWAKAWAHMPADRQAREYVEAKRGTRGEAAAKRTLRQVNFARRAAAAIEAVRH